MTWEVTLNDIDDFAQNFWKAVPHIKVFAFHGQMGAGKTTIISALCRTKGVTSAPSSPTFSIINEYAYTENGKEKVLYHIDLYRLKDMEEVLQTGVADCIDSGSICFVEWPEIAPSLFDEAAMHVFIEAADNNKRLIKTATTAAT